MVKRSLKNRKGFTLVEVIVVAVIVAVLAAVAIPLYLGYVMDSRKNVAENLAGSVCSASGATVQQGLVLPAAKTYIAGDAIVFPSNTNSTNQILVPTGFSVTLTSTTAKAFFTKEEVKTGSTCTFSSGS